MAAAGAGERVALASNNAIGPQPIALQGWLEEGAATELLAMAGHDLPSLRIAARQPGFTAFELDGGRAAGNQWIADYVGNCYHKPCDAWSPDWNLTGAVQDIELFRLLVEDLGNSRRWPEWRAESEFKAVRDVSEASRR